MKKNYALFMLTLLFTWAGFSQVTLTQSVDPVNVTGGGVACWSAPPNGTGEYRENSFYRAYNLADFGVTGDFIISSLEYGQGSADEGKVITLNVYTASSENLASATLTLVQTAFHVSVAADNTTLISVPMTATIPANSIIAFEVLAADGGTATGQTFFPGINAAGQNDPSYLKATGCSITVPTNTASVSAASQYVMNILGNDALSVDEFSVSKVSISPNPTSDFVNIELHPSNTINSIEIYSITGQLVSKLESATRIDISNLQSGIYLMKVETSNGTSTQKLIKT